MNRKEKPKSKRNWLETIKNIVGILAGISTIAFRVYQFLNK